MSDEQSFGRFTLLHIIMTPLGGGNGQLFVMPRKHGNYCTKLALPAHPL